MLNMPLDVLQQHPVRKNRPQKRAFRNAVEAYVSRMGVSFCLEKGNIIIGDPEKAKYLVTAHYDTGVALPVSNRLYAEGSVFYVLHQLYIGVLLTLLPIILSCVCSVAAMLVYYRNTGLLDAGDLIPLGVVVFVLSLVALLLISHWTTYWGPANKNNANNNTSGVITVLECLRSLPESQRHKVCFVLFDRYETGMKGSACYYRKHRQALQKQLVLDLSCVGDGDHIFLFTTDKLKQNNTLLPSIYKCCGYFGAKSILVKEKGRAAHPADYQKFPYAVGISAFKKGKNGHYIDRIHTSRDTILDITNVNLLRTAICSMICGDAAH